MSALDGAGLQLIMSTTIVQAAGRSARAEFWLRLPAMAAADAEKSQPCSARHLLRHLPRYFRAHSAAGTARRLLTSTARAAPWLNRTAATRTLYVTSALVRTGWLVARKYRMRSQSSRRVTAGEPLLAIDSCA